MTGDKGDVCGRRAGEGSVVFASCGTKVWVGTERVIVEVFVPSLVEDLNPGHGIETWKF
ncbi:hypothetical protein OAL27_00485 [Verrucomicrobiales bacterium]|nr:hypothetical protein [Verrucomicrobiales bacterium]